MEIGKPDRSGCPPSTPSTASEIGKTYVALASDAH